MSTHLTPVAEYVAACFAGYLNDFNAVTRRAAQHFASCDWGTARSDAGRRLGLYRDAITETLEGTRERMAELAENRSAWMRLRRAYDQVLGDLSYRPVAETWFNSLTRRAWDTVGVDGELEFLAPGPAPAAEALKMEVSVGSTLAEMLAGAIRSVAPDGSWRDFDADVALCAERVAPTLAVVPDRIEMAPEPFYRGRACYLVGRMILADHVQPLVFALHNLDGRMTVDAVISDEDRVSILFSFTRSHFQVVCDCPASLVEFLSTLMPRKRVAELYISIGLDKHGKTELYRDLLHHLAHTEERFRIAPGQRGLVMTVFGMPDYDIVFKIIKDTFPPPKRTTRGQIREKYRLVYQHDRAGRLVEAHEFEHLSLARDRFEPELLNLLAAEAARTVEVEEERVVIHHAYVERKVTPLDLYLRERDLVEAQAAINDYAHAIRDLMASDIFPGDMLLKNFGVTRHGRVVFYDYDELSRIQDCTFRKIPPAPTIEDEMSDTPWFSVSEGDVFPEEFPRFMGLPAELRADFYRTHADLFDHRTWQACQQRILAGEVIEISPYPPSYRLRP